jgi:hypothetical protein
MATSNLVFELTDDLALSGLLGLETLLYQFIHGHLRYRLSVPRFH